MLLDETGPSSKRWMRAKMLKFKENYRPAYYGTWRKKSKLIRPRAPLTKDTTFLDYEVVNHCHLLLFWAYDFVNNVLFYINLLIISK